MKALKTVAVALGITLGGPDRHPAGRPGRAVRLAQADRRGRRGVARARPGRRLIDRPSRSTRSMTPAGSPAGVGVPARPWATSHRVAEARPSCSSMVAWAGELHRRQGRQPACSRRSPSRSCGSGRPPSCSSPCCAGARAPSGCRSGQVAPILGLGAIGFGLYQMLWATALQSIPAGDFGLPHRARRPSSPCSSPASSGSDTLNRPKLVGALLSFLGVGIVIAAGPGLVLGASLVGDLLTLAAALCFAVYTAWGAPILRPHSPLRTTAWAIVAGTIVLAPLGLVQLAAPDWPGVGAGAWVGFVYSALLPAGHRQRRRLPCDPAPRPDPDHRLPVPRPVHRGPAGRRLPGRVDSIRPRSSAVP